MAVPIAGSIAVLLWCQRCKVNRAVLDLHHMKGAVGVLMLVHEGLPMLFAPGGLFLLRHASHRGDGKIAVLHDSDITQIDMQIEAHSEAAQPDVCEAFGAKASTKNISAHWHRTTHTKGQGKNNAEFACLPLSGSFMGGEVCCNQQRCPVFCHPSVFVCTYLSGEEDEQVCRCIAVGIAGIVEPCIRCDRAAEQNDHV
ncbi:hypothetical protein [Noviherbaspirillum agri]